MHCFIGWLANKIGQKQALHICLAVWIVVLISGFMIQTMTQFWFMAALTALVMGGTQSVSRTIMGLMTPEFRTGEFFGFFNLSGKAFSMLGPILFTEILNRTESPNWAIISLLVFFVVGWAIIAPLNIARGHAQSAARFAGRRVRVGRAAALGFGKKPLNHLAPRRNPFACGLAGAALASRNGQRCATVRCLWLRAGNWRPELRHALLLRFPINAS